MLTLTIEPGAGVGDAPPGREVNTWANEAGHVFARAFVDAGSRWIDWQGLGRFTFAPGSSHVRVRLAAGASLTALHATFDRVIQPVILQALGWQALHASGVAGPYGALLFCGLGRSGKSTLAYAAGQRSGYTQIADDAIVIDFADPQPRVHPLPFPMGLRPDAVERLGPDETGSTMPVGVSGPLPVRAVFALSQDTAASTDGHVLRVAPVEAFPLLLTHAHCFDESDATSMRRMVEAYLAMAAAVPVYALRYRPDFASLDTLVNTVLDIDHRAVSAPDEP